VVRAVSDSGYGSSPGNAMEMINWINKDSGAAGPMSLPVMRVTNGKKNSDHAVPESFGFWCKKSARMAGVQPNPRNRVPYNLEDAHFAIAALSVPAQNNTGVVFQASKTEDLQTSELGFTNGQPRAKWVDSKGQTVQLLAPAKLAANTPAVLALTSVAGAQKLRLNSAEVGSAPRPSRPAPSPRC
jgi:endoglucanase